MSSSTPLVWALPIMINPVIPYFIVGGGKNKLMVYAVAVAALNYLLYLFLIAPSILKKNRCSYHDSLKYALPYALIPTAFGIIVPVGAYFLMNNNDKDKEGTDFILILIFTVLFSFVGALIANAIIDKKTCYYVTMSKSKII